LKRYIKISAFILILFHCGSVVYSQNATARPKLGLALSGGGSLGMAHVGVLRVMEEAGLRPDYITGVSMGSIVGSLYSIGYRSDTLSKMFKKANWDLILSNNLPENKVIFTEKKYFNNSIISFPISSRKVRLPSGLINGQQIEKMLSYYTWPAVNIEDFSKFPIPFLCIGTDLISCKKVVLKKGYLPDAIRASMAVPSIFTPVKIDTAVLIDGGFVRNIAVSELKEMGADIIIGSYTGFHKYSENELQSVPGILKQLSFFNSYNDYTEQKKLIDYLIEPRVKDLSSTVFTNADSIIQRGYVAALPFREKFRKLADSLNMIGPQQPVESILNRHSLAFDKIEIIGNDIISDDQILGVLDIKPGKQIDRDMLSEKIDLLYGRSWFDKVKYRIVPGNDSLKLVIDCIEKPQAILYGSVHYDSFLKAGVLLNLSVKNLLTPRSLIDIESYLAQFYRFKIYYTQFIDRNQILGLSAYFSTGNTLIPVLELNDEIGQFICRNYSTGLNLNKRTGLNHLMTISAGYKNINLIPDFIPTNRLKRVSYNYLEANYLNQINTLDTKHFPNRGSLFQISIDISKLLSGKMQTDYSKKTYTPESPGEFLFKRSYSATGDFKQYFSPGNKLTFAFGGDFLMTYTKDSITSPHNYYFAGGPDYTFNRSIPLIGFHSAEIPVDRYAGIRFDFDFEFQKDLHLGLVINSAIAREPDMGGDLSFLGGYGLGVGYMSIIGPLKIGVMHGFSNKERYFSAVKAYISIGFGLYR
jgi:NTE family protein